MAVPLLFWKFAPIIGCNPAEPFPPIVPKARSLEPVEPKLYVFGVELEPLPIPYVLSAPDPVSTKAHPVGTAVPVAPEFSKPVLTGEVVLKLWKYGTPKARGIMAARAFTPAAHSPAKASKRFLMISI